MAIAGGPDNLPSPGQVQTQPSERVVLFEEDKSDPQGRRLNGSAVWRIEKVSGNPGGTPIVAVRADIQIPDRGMKIIWTLRSNSDKALPASHTIEIAFNEAENLPGGGIASVPGILMKDTPDGRGVPLAGLAVKVTNGFYLIGLSAVPSEVESNVHMLKSREWFDIPIVYTNGSRAIIALSKGASGGRALADALAVWEK